MVEDRLEPELEPEPEPGHLRQAEDDRQELGDHQAEDDHHQAEDDHRQVEGDRLRVWGVASYPYRIGKVLLLRSSRSPYSRRPEIYHSS